MRRFSVVLAIVLLSSAGLFLLGSGPASAASHTWTTDTDFAGGSFLSTEVSGTGSAALVRLQTNPQKNWINMAPIVGPIPRRGPAMVFDETNNVVLMFGGVTSASLFLNDLWTYNTATNTWTNVTPGTSPPARWKAGFSYDSVEKIAVLYGGLDGGGGRTDTWEYSVVSGTWLQTTPTPSPRPFYTTPLVYDSVVHRHILAGEEVLGGVFQTWAYNAVANTWTNLNPLGVVPDPRQGHTVTFDRVTLNSVLFGGAQGLNLYGDWWHYNSTNNDWTKDGDHIPNVTPNQRTDHAMTFGPNGAVNLMIGGTDASSAYQPETWYYISPANLWAQPFVGTTPTARKDHALVWDSQRDATAMFGGQLSSSAITNQTWIWGTGYYNSGTYESPTFDSGCALPDWTDVWWNATTPSGTTVRFKLATSTSSTGPWTFVGPDGLPGTFYDTPGTAVSPGNDAQEYFRWRAYLTTGDIRVTPDLQDFEVNYVCGVAPPFIVSTNPADGASGVPLLANIVITFSEPMQEGTVTLAFSDASITFTRSWDATSTVLTLSHTTPFSECALQTVQVTGGKDQNDNLNLIPGPVPNPWSFTSACINPYIQTTNPADAAVNVAQLANLVVTFSEPMDTPTVTWTITGGISLAGAWDGTESVLTLSHGVAFAQCTVYTAQITAGNDKVGLPLVAGPVPNPWSFTTICGNPYIASTDPADGTTGVPLTNNIIVTFSEAMDTPTVMWTVSGGVATTYTWQPGNDVLVLSHAVAFAEVTTYTVQVTAGNDTSGNPLVAGPVPNPWSFTTEAVAPFIVSTNPADGVQNVGAAADVVVTFSEPMNIATVTATSNPPIVFTRAWNPSNTILTLSHTTPFAPCTTYTMTVGGDDLQALALVPGPVPNPWSFVATCPLTGPANLQLTIAGPDVVLSWDAVLGATGYKVYSAQNRFAGFPSGWTVLGTPATTTFLAAGHGTDTLTHYYVVRATSGAAEGPNSTMGAKAHLSFGFSSSNTNIAWFSLPYASGYARASDIATALGNTKIDVVGKWDAARQSSTIYYYSRGAWRGTDFNISAGNGLYLGVRSAFTWDVTGTDRSVGLSFTRNGPPTGNVNWVSMPYTGTYSRASDIATELTSTKVTEIGLWDATTQTSVRYFWMGSAWAGTDFTFTPGAGVYIIIASSFTWTPALVTPTVP